MKHLQTSLVLLLLLCSGLVGTAQITGTVTDAKSQKPLEDVYIKAEGQLIDITNEKGQFELDSLNIRSLTFHHIGYKTDTLFTIDDAAFLQITLQPIRRLLPTAGVMADEPSYDLHTAYAIHPDSVFSQSLTASPGLQMNLAPPVNFSRGTRNTQKMTIRGIGSRGQYSTTRVKPYLNGIPLSSSMGEMFLDDMLYGRLAKMEIIPGPVATPLGSSSGGLMVMQSKIPDSRRGQISSGAVVGGYGYVHQFNSLEFNEEHIVGSVDYQWMQDKGFRENDTYNGNDFSSVFRVKLSEESVLQSFTSYSNFKAFIPSSLSESDFRNNPRSAAQNWLDAKGYEQDKTLIQGLSLEHRFNPKLTNSTTLYGIGYRGKERRPFNVLKDKTGTIGLRTEFEQKDIFHLSGLLLKTGAAYQYDAYQWGTFETLPNDNTGEELTSQKQTRHDGGIFLFASYQLGVLNASAGAFAGKTTYETSDLLNSQEQESTYNSGISVSPSLRLGYTVSETSELFFAISRGITAPSYEEAIDSDGMINTSLNPEDGWLRELGLHYRLAEQRLTGRTSGFYTSIQNQIVTKRLAEDRFVKRNAGETDYLGLEHWMSYALITQPRWHMHLAVSYTFSDFSFQQFTDEGNDYSGNALPGIPQHKGGAQIMVNIADALSVSSDFYASGKVPMNDANDKYYKGYSLLNVSASYKQDLASNYRMKLFFQMENVLNSNYAAMLLVNAPSYGGSAPRYYYPGVPRTFRVGIELNYLPDFLYFK